jgi:DNA-binding NarL/FixJ family response regulator
MPMLAARPAVVETALRNSIAQIEAALRRRSVMRRYPQAYRVFEVYCDSPTTLAAARQLGLSPRTVENHVATIMRAVDAVAARQAAFRLWGPAR